jgi:hypothetical protein
MELVAINREGTLFVSGEIDDWSVVRGRGMPARRAGPEADGTLARSSPDRRF